MIKPNNYDNVQAFGGFTPLELGGHILIIKKVEEGKSSTGKDMIRIFLDTHASDKQPNYYSEQYKSDTRKEKKWGCIVYQLVLDAKGDTSRGIKTFMDAIKSSNPGFVEKFDKVEGDNIFINNLKDKLVGGVFGREEYYNNYGESKFVIKCISFRNIEAIKNEVDVPADKLLGRNSNNSSGTDELIPVDNGDLPF